MQSFMPYSLWGCSFFVASIFLVLTKAKLFVLITKHSCENLIYLEVWVQIGEKLEESCYCLLFCSQSQTRWTLLEYFYKRSIFFMSFWEEEKCKAVVRHWFFTIKPHKKKTLVCTTTCNTNFVILIKPPLLRLIQTMSRAQLVPP